jgi:hypothetical protein
MKQTAVEWLVEELEKHHIKIDIKNTVAVQQAKAMEKEQLIGLLEWMNKVTAESPMRLETDHDDIVEQYLIETYERKPNL